MEKMALVEMPGPGPVNKDGLAETDGSTLTSTFQNTHYEKTCKYKDYKPRGNYTDSAHIRELQGGRG